MRVGIIHRKADRIIGFVYQADVGHRPIWRISAKRTHSQPSSSPGHEAILRKPSDERSAAREFRSPAFQPVGLPIRTEFRVGWMAEGRAPFRPRVDQEVSGTGGVPQAAAPTPRREGAATKEGRRSPHSQPRQPKSHSETSDVRAVPDGITTTATRPSTVPREGPAPTPHLH